jgi:hypothetical protein
MPIRVLEKLPTTSATYGISTKILGESEKLDNGHKPNKCFKNPLKEEFW